MMRHHTGHSLPGTASTNKRHKPRIKHIVVCSDGTGNTTIKCNTVNKYRGANALKLCKTINLNGQKKNYSQTPKIAIYDDGIGADSIKLLRLLAGVLRFGLSRNIQQLYAELCKIYKPGDRIYLFGFSRGAYTVRILAGLINDCGIIDTKQWDKDTKQKKLVKKAWKANRRQYCAWLGRQLLGLLTSATKKARPPNTFSSSDLYFQ